MIDGSFCGNGKPDGNCVLKHVTADLYTCQNRRNWCRYGLSFGVELFCRHPDRARWRQEVVLQPSATLERMVDA